MVEIKSDKRNFSLKTPLGEDELIVESFSGKDEISRLFTYTLELESLNPNINYDDIVSKNVTLSILLPDQSKRFINGHVNRFVQSTESGDMSTYQMEMVPWLWFLTQTTDLRIFQEKSVPDIIKQIFDDAGFSGKYTDSLSGSYDPREYCVQYRETDFNFVSRLMEEEGIFYFFKHEDGDHKLILGDASSAHSPIEPAGDLEFFLGGEETTPRPAVTQISCEQSIRPTAVSYKDFDFKKPSTDLTVKEEKNSKHEIYDYPGNYRVRAAGEHLAKVRLEEENTTRKLFYGSTTDRRLAPGFTAKLIDHPRDDFNATYLITMVHQSGNQTEEDVTYECNFELIPEDTPFRASKITEKPVVTGLQTAIVTGPSGEEIWLDKYGRIKVQFHWDREGKKDEKSSCWIRVAQNWAGKNWGIVFHPRIGQEVIVHFEEGDIDRPLVTGRIYNEELMPPYELPLNSTQSTIKSRSSKGGEPDNFNEIRFEDKKGEEHFLIHAEKDHQKEVENDETHSVGHDRSKTIGNDETTDVGNNRAENVGNDESITIGNNRTENVGKDETISIGANRTESVGKNETISIGANRSENVTKNETITIGKDKSDTIGKNLTVDIGDNSTLNVGKKDIQSIGKELLVDVGDKVVYKCGKASITLKKDGTIKIEGKDITIKGSGKINVKASKDVVVKGSKIVQN